MLVNQPNSYVSQTAKNGVYARHNQVIFPSSFAQMPILGDLIALTSYIEQSLPRATLTPESSV